MEPLKTVGSTYRPEPKPKDDLHHLFVDTVVDLVGRAKFGDKWGGAGKSQQWTEVVDLLAEMAREGRLEGFAQFGGFSRIRPEEWAKIEVHKAFRRGQIHKFDDSRWLYFSVISVQALLFRQARPSRTSAAFTYDMQSTRWPLFEAAVWAATGGMDTNTAAIAEGNLEEAGCRTIFDKLADLGGFGVPEISGLTPLFENRQSIPSRYLERTHTGWLGSGSGHLVRFYEASDPRNPEALGRVVADFTPKGHLAPTLFELSMLRDDVLALFPRREGTAKSSGNPAIDDDARLVRMLNMIKGGAAKSVTAAAGLVAKDEPGHSESATKRRLIGKFGKAYPGRKREYHPRDPK